jgi:two-component system OmpR family response regulator
MGEIQNRPFPLNHIRTQSPSLPALTLSGRGGVEDGVKGPDLGASDFLAKPFSFKELSARVRALLRRSPERVEIVLRVEDLELYRAKRVVRRATALT